MYKSANVTIKVSDMKRAIAFYRDVLGFSIVADYGGEFAEIDAAGLRIGLHPGGKRPLAEHPRHMQLGLRVDDLDAAMATLRERGLALGPVTRDPGLRFANFTDLDGNPFYLVEIKWG